MSDASFELREHNVVAEKLKSLACIECVKNWLKEFEDNSKPLNDIESCYKLGLITPELRSRLIDEINALQISS